MTPAEYAVIAIVSGFLVILMGVLSCILASLIKDKILKFQALSEEKPPVDRIFGTRIYPGMWVKQGDPRDLQLSQDDKPSQEKR